jgi:RNase adapter protein RapZ
MLRDLVIVTGMSGSGKGTVLKVFEDMGFFCIDNLPVALIRPFVEEIHSTEGEIRHAVLVIDIRAGQKLNELEKEIKDLRQSAFHVFVLYLEAKDDVLMRRFSETRRPHPISAEIPLQNAIRIERTRLVKMRDLADATLDTSDYTVHQIKSLVMERFLKHSSSFPLNIHLISFGYKNGIPLEADLMFDVRFISNPYFVARLKNLSGKDRAVVNYLRSFPETNEFVKRIGNLLQYLLPKYVKEGKRYLSIAVGCTGGRHRSVFVVEELARLLKRKKRDIYVRHRDVNL